MHAESLAWAKEGRAMQSKTGWSEGRFGGLVCAVLVLCGASCVEGAGSAAPAEAPAGGTSREQVLGCFAAQYKAKMHEAAPVEDEDGRRAADQLLARYNGKPKRACGAIQAALSGSLCGMPVTLASVVACERRGREDRTDKVIDPAKKDELQNRVRENERRNIDPMQGGY